MCKYLSGVKPTGQFHIGNFSSIIKPIKDMKVERETLVLIADLHAMTSTSIKDIIKYKKDIYNIFKSFDIHNLVFQSDLQHLTYLYWMLSCHTAKGLLNRAHSYKDSVAKNRDNNKDDDKGVFMGMYTYPVLMAADLAYFDTEYVFIGKDQQQHMNIANDIVNKFNHDLKVNLSVPEPIIVQDHNIMGYDGRKMSKSYNNVIPLMCSSKSLKKKLNSIKTNSKMEGEEKFYDESPIFEIFEIFAREYEKKNMETFMVTGSSWGKIKNYTFDVVDSYLTDFREEYNRLNKSKEFWYEHLHINSNVEKVLM